MDIILIPCCKRKVVGGDRKYQTSVLADILDTTTINHLMEARLNLGKQLKLQPGPDLGFQEEENIAYLPAYLRYNGVIYQGGNVRNLYKQFGGRVIILSALYGLLDANDTIRNYDLAMTDMLPVGMRVSTFWKKHGLRDIIEEYYLAASTAVLHDLLSNTYRKALEPWPSPKIIHYHAYNYPGLRTASNFPRGKDLKQLLSQ